jgi:hypothetical protein
LRSYWLVSAVFLTLTTSVEAGSALDGFNDDPTKRLRFAVDPFEEPIGYLMLEGNSSDMIVRRFGEPDRVDESIIQTRFPSESYTLLTYRYQDFTFMVGKWPDREWSWIESIEIVGNSQKLKYDIRIGSSREQVSATFSLTEPNSEKGILLRASAHIAETPSDVGEDGSTLDEVGATYSIFFEFDDDDRVSKISIGSLSSD